MTLATRLAAALFTASAYASYSNMVTSDTLVVRAEDVLYRPYASLISSNGALSRRQTDDLSDVPVTDSTNTTVDEIPLNADGSLNVTAWDSATDEACVQSLSALPQSTNPSGACVCYNLPSLDAETGVFEADLRLYKVSDPRGSFAGVDPKEINVSLSYNGATVTPVKAENLTASGMKGKVAGMSKRDGAPELMRSYLLVGQIDKDRMSENLTMASLECLIMPTLTLSAKNSTGGKVRTTVSINEASFLTGVFSREVVMSDWGMAEVAVAAQHEALKNGTVAFVLPGVQLMVYPIGLIITSVWLVLGVVAYGIGTYERIMYAEMYKRRQAVNPNRGKPI